MSQAITLNVAALAAVAVAMAKQDVRYYLNGACVERDEAGRVTLVATNGHAMVAATDPGMTWTGDTERDGKAAQLILPRDFVTAILKAAKGSQVVTVAVGAACARHEYDTARELSATIGTVTLRAQSLDGQFPDWRLAMRPAVPSAGKYMAAFDAAVLSIATDAATAWRKVAGTKRVAAGSVQFIAAGEAATGFALHGTYDALIAGVVMPLRDMGDDAPARDVLRAVIADAEVAPVAAAA